MWIYVRFRFGSKASSSPGRFSMALEKAPRLEARTNVTLCPVCDRSLVPKETVNFDSRESRQRERLRETKLTVSRRTSLEVICHRHIWKFWSWKFMKPRCKGAVRCYPLTSQILQRFCRETVEKKFPPSYITNTVFIITIHLCFWGPGSWMILFS